MADELMNPETGEVDEGRLISIIQNELNDSVGHDGDRYDSERRALVDAYLGRKYGNEKQGFSQHVDRTVFETVEAIMPFFMKVFHGNDQSVLFAPTEDDQVEMCQEATDYVNHVYNVDNPGYLITEEVIKDACIQRVGWWKHYWRTEVKEETKRFTGLAPEEVMMLGAMQGGEVEVLSENEETGLMDVQISRQVETGRIAVESVPPQQVIFARRAASVDETPFIAHVDIVTRSDLIAEGYDREIVESLPAISSGATDLRRGQYSRDNHDSITARTDTAMEEVETAECFIQIDLDGDGIAEWQRVFVGGISESASGGRVLEIEPCDGHPFTPCVIIPLSHQIEGLSIADTVEDLQRLRTEATRQMIDGLFLTNHPRWKRVAGKVDVESLHDNRPGGSVEVKDIAALDRLDQRWEGGQALAFLQELDKITERRAGVSPHGSVQASSAMTRHAEGTVDSIMQASLARQELMARNIAEIGFTRLYRELLKLAIRHQDGERKVRFGQSFRQYNPSSWSPELDVEVNPALGAGRNAMRMQALTTVGGVMQQLMQSGFRGIGEEQIYNWFKDVLKAADMPAIDPYLMDVTKMDPPQPPPPPDPTQDIVYVVEKMKQDAALERERIKADVQRDKTDADLAIEAEKLESQEVIANAKELQKQNDGQTPSPAQPAQSDAPPVASAPQSSPAEAAPPAETFFPDGAPQ